MLGTFRYFRCEPMTHARIVDGDGKYAPIYSESYGDPELGEVGPRPTFLESTEERRSAIIIGLSQANASSGYCFLFVRAMTGMILLVWRWYPANAG